MGNVKVKVRTMWGNGLVSLSTPYVLKALNRQEGLEIEYKGNIMQVSYEDLLKKNSREALFKDKFGRKKKYSLYDFFWSTSR